MMRKIIHIVLLILFPAGLFFILGFATSSNQQKPCDRLTINVSGHNGDHFLYPADVRQIITGELDTVEGKIMHPDLLHEIDRVVKSIPYVDQASTYRTINNELKIEVTLKDALLRVINSKNQSYYIDRDGELFPLSDKHTARVLIASGRIQTEYSPGKNIAEADGETEELMRKLYGLASYIEQDDFWKAFIDHIYVGPNGKFELTPKNGAHIIEFGHARHIETKFGNLRKFYQHTLPQIGWHHYNKVNVEFNDQIICSK
ncbi:MAG: cell division protein FtsQ/DivIB [Bacteroidales bacterium]